MNTVRFGLALFAILSLANSGCDRSPSTAAQATSQSTGGKSTAESTPKPSTERIVDSDFDDIKFEMEKTGAFERAMLTSKIEGLLDRKIRIRGFMFPTLRKRGLTKFVLVRDNLECCFGPGAALYDCILVHMNEGQTAEYSIRPIAVEGTFRFDEVIGPDGKHLAIYRLDGDSAE